VQSGDILLVEAIDRLSRKGIRPTQDLVNSILNAGIDIAILSPVQKVYRANDTNDIGGAIELAAFAYAAYTYSENLSYRIKNHFDRARVKARENGKAISGHLPCWIENENKGKLDHDGKPRGITMKVKPEVAAAIRQVFELVISGLGAHRLTSELTRLGIKPIGNTSRWNGTFIRKLVRDKAVLGWYQPHTNDEAGKRQPIGEPIKNYYPQIIDEDTWERANASLDNRVIERREPKGYINLFGGLTWLALDDCPAHLYTYQQTRADGRKITIRRLQSYNAKCKVKGATTATVDLVAFEHVFLQDMKGISLPKENKSPALTALATVNARLANKQKRIAEITLEIETGETPIPQLAASLNKLTLEVKDLVAEQRKLLATVNSGGVASVNSIADLEQTPENRIRLREAIKQAVERIDLYPAKLGKLKRSPVACLAVMRFRNGYTRVLVQCGYFALSTRGNPSSNVSVDDKGNFSQPSSWGGTDNLAVNSWLEFHGFNPKDLTNRKKLTAWLGGIVKKDMPDIKVY
jgi:DNA invertase Pin-like site-specific DNA recombinase